MAACSSRPVFLCYISGFTGLVYLGLGLPFIIAIAVYGVSISTGGDLKMPSVILFLSLIILVVLLLVSRWKIGKPAGFILLALYLFYVGREIYFM
jgi:Ca2+/Na+ antiporter